MAEAPCLAGTWGKPHLGHRWRVHIFVWKKSSWPITCVSMASFPMVFPNLWTGADVFEGMKHWADKALPTPWDTAASTFSNTLFSWFIGKFSSDHEHFACSAKPKSFLGPRMLAPGRYLWCFAALHKGGVDCEAAHGCSTGLAWKELIFLNLLNMFFFESRFEVAPKKAVGHAPCHVSHQDKCSLCKFVKAGKIWLSWTMCFMMFYRH